MFRSSRLIKKNTPFNRDWSSYSNSKSRMFYSFTFISLISPFLLNDLRLHVISSSPTTRGKSTALVKQSYLLFTWFYYLKESAVHSNKKNWSFTDKPISFSFLPTRSSNYTLTKAPMAHKTNSKEQYSFRFFKFKTSIQTFIPRSVIPSSIDSGLISVLLIKSVFPVFETNLLLLKHYTITFKAKDSYFFSLLNPLVLKP